MGGCSFSVSNIPYLPTVRKQFLNVVLKEYAKENLVLVITHDRPILRDADSIVEMRDGNNSAVKECGAV